MSLAEEKRQLHERAELRLREHLTPGGDVMVGATGGAEPWTANLAPGVSPKEVEAAYGSDPAWQDDLALPHSSAALTVNLFAPWQADLERLSIAGVSGFNRFQFEVNAPLGLEGAPAYFDAFGTSARRFVAIEVKCLEYLSQPSEKYRLGFEQSIRQICETNGSSEAGWLGEANRLNRDLKTYSALFAHQLVKQAFALRHQHGRDRHLLFYLFWEPVDWSRHPFFVIEGPCAIPEAEVQAGGRLELVTGRFFGEVESLSLPLNASSCWSGLTTLA